MAKERKIIDISRSLEAGMEVWPGDPDVELETLFEGAGVISRLSMSTHAGTHVDAPRHLAASLAGIESVELEKLCGTAQVVEPSVMEKNSTLITSLPALREGVSRVLIKTGYRPGNTPPDFTGISLSLARFLIDSGIVLIGTDSPSIEALPTIEDETFAVHDLLLTNSVAVVENLDLDHVRPGVYQLFCLPLKLTGADGAPARAILIGEED